MQAILCILDSREKKERETGREEKVVVPPMSHISQSDRRTRRERERKKTLGEEKFVLTELMSVNEFVCICICI